MYTDRQLALIFSFCDSLGTQKIEKAKSFFGSLQAAFDCLSLKDWSQTGWSKKDIEKWLSIRKGDQWQSRFAWIEKEHNYCSVFEDDYPSLLKEIHSPPLVLFYQGQWSLVKKKCLAIVGTRKASSYSRKIINQWMLDLVQNDLVIVSGLALGVDSIAHLECLKNNGFTIAVLAGGFNEIYPTINRELAKKILEKGGLLLSENAPDYRALPFNFPARNRIVSGLSLGVLVTEAPKKSGAMITAYMAMEQNRSVMAVSGDIFRETSQGCNKLIKQGALPAEEVDDILLELGIKKDLSRSGADSKGREYNPANPTEEKILQLLREGSYSVDEMCLQTNIGYDELISTLNFLLLEGVVEELPGGMWALNS